MTFAPATTCVRSAWLTMGSSTVQLDYPPGGWFCQSLDLGYPEVRDVMTSKPDQDGVDDRTQFMGARTVTATITALRGAGARIDAVASQFAPFMVPSARPVLHYVLDRPGAAERTLTLRASGYSWPIVGADQRDILLQWVAADPIARDPNVRTVTAWSGSSSAPGRNYNLIFNRVYPVGGGSSTSAIVSTPGDVPIRPLLRIYGPISGPWVYFSNHPWLVGFQSSYVLNAGHWIDVDTANRTAYLDGDRTKSILNQMDWISTKWPVIAPLPNTELMTLRGSNMSGITQVQATWQDGYLT
jgi:hypothetical protein